MSDVGDWVKCLDGQIVEVLDESDRAGRAVPGWTYTEIGYVRTDSIVEVRKATVPPMIAGKERG